MRTATTCGTCSQPLRVQNAEEGPEVEVNRMEVDGVDEEGAVDGEHLKEMQHKQVIADLEALLQLGTLENRILDVSLMFFFVIHTSFIHHTKRNFFSIHF